jgi:hypothetical protein
LVVYHGLAMRSSFVGVFTFSPQAADNIRNLDLTEPPL